MSNLVQSYFQSSPAPRLSVWVQNRSFICFFWISRSDWSVPATATHSYTLDPPPPSPNLHRLEQRTSRAVAPKAFPSVLQRLFPSHMAPSFPRSQEKSSQQESWLRNQWSSWQYPLFSSPIAESLCLYQTLHFFVKGIFFLRNFQCVSTAWFPSDSSTILNNWAQVRESVQTSTHLSHWGGPLPSLWDLHTHPSPPGRCIRVSATQEMVKKQQIIHWSPKWTTDNSQRLL